MLVGIDTNILVYAEGVGIAGDQRFERAVNVLQQLPGDRIFLPVQVLGELYNVLVRKGGFSRRHSAERVAFWRSSYPALDTTAESFDAAINLTRNHNFSIWDAVVICTAAQAGCRLLLSEDMQDGFDWSGITVVNPFAAEINPLLATLLDRK